MASVLKCFVFSAVTALKPFSNSKNIHHRFDRSFINFFYLAPLAMASFKYPGYANVIKIATFLGVTATSSSLPHSSSLTHLLLVLKGLIAYLHRTSAGFPTRAPIPLCGRVLGRKQDGERTRGTNKKSFHLLHRLAAAAAGCICAGLLGRDKTWGGRAPLVAMLLRLLLLLKTLVGKQETD